MIKIQENQKISIGVENQNIFYCFLHCRVWDAFDNLSKHHQTQVIPDSLIENTKFSYDF